MSPSRIFLNMFIYATFQITTVLHSLSSWEERLNYFIQNNSHEVVYSKTYLKQLLNSVYIKIKAILNYKDDPNSRLKTRTMLIRPTEQVSPIVEDYGISKVISA